MCSSAHTLSASARKRGGAIDDDGTVRLHSRLARRLESERRGVFGARLLRLLLHRGHGLVGGERLVKRLDAELTLEAVRGGEGAAEDDASFKTALSASPASSAAAPGQRFASAHAASGVMRVFM